LLQFKPPHSHFYQEVASNQLESRPPTSPTPLLYPSPLIPLEKLQFSLFLTVLQAFNYFIAQNLHDAEILPFFERPESDYSLSHDENLAYYSRIVPKYFSFVPDEHLNACVEIYNQFHDVYPRYSTYDTPDLASDCNRLRFDRVLDGYHWDFLIWVWNLSEFQKNWVKRHEMDCNFGSLGDVLDKIMDKIHIVSGGKSVGCVDRGGEREITKRKLPGKEKLNLFDFCGEKRVGNKKLEKDDFVDLLEILSWSKSPGDDDNICSLDDGYLWTNEGYADVICAMMNEMEEKAKRWLEMVKENDEQWKRWSKWERHVSRGFKTDKNNDKLTKSDQNDEKYITNAYVFKIPKKYMILRGRNLPWYSGNIPKHIGLNGKMNQSIQNSMREPYKFGNPGDCIYSDDELEGFYNDYLLWARGEGEVMKCNGSYKKNQYDDDKFINNNPDRLRLYDITDYELNDINEGVISQLIQSEFGYGLWGEFFLEDKMFHKTRKNPYIIQQWLKFQPGYEEKYGANGDPREKCLQLFISDFVKLYKCYTNHSFDDFESEKNGQTNQLTLHNTSKRHVVINGGDCDEKPQELLPDKLPERLFWVVPLHEYTKVKSKNNPNRGTVLEENLSLLHKVLNSHLIQFSQQRIDDLKACWEYDVYVLHYLMSLCEEFRDPFRQLAQGNLQAPENELFKSHPFIVRNDLRYFQSLLPNFFTYFNDDGTINHDINPYLTETLRSHAPDSCKITLVFTHIDLFYLPWGHIIPHIMAPSSIPMPRGSLLLIHLYIYAILRNFGIILIQMSLLLIH
jgi:hypothetical protein